MFTVLKSVILRKHNKRNSMLLVIFSAAIWGLIWIPLRYMESLGLYGLWATLYFYLIPLLPLAYFGHKKLFGDIQNIWKYLLIGFFMGGAFTCYAAGLVIATVSKTTILYYLTPIWATLLGIIFLSERASIFRWSCIFFGLLGCTLVMQIDIRNFYFELADLWGLSSGILWGVGAIIVRYFDDLKIENSFFPIYFFSSLFTFLAILLLNFPIPSITSFFSAFPYAAIFSIFIYLPAFLIILRVQQYLSPGLVGVLMLSEILLALISAKILLGEPITNLQWLGAVCIILTGLLISIVEGKKTP